MQNSIRADQIDKDVRLERDGEAEAFSELKVCDGISMNLVL